MRVRFHLPDFSGNFKLNLLFAELLERRPDLFREGVEIASFYGVFPPSIWNGGRTQGGVCDKTFVKSVIKTFNEKSIPLRFTFTNPALEKKHLSDQFCNMVLNLANNGLNEAIVMSPVLEDYIRRNFPKYKLTSSTCKRLNTIEGLLEELKKDYHIVVMDYDLNNRFELLEQIPMEDRPRIEFLSNACCEPNCPRRSAHYHSIGVQQIAYNEHIKKNPGKPFNIEKYDPQHFRDCPYSQRGLFEIRNLRTHISPDDIWEKYVPMGFEQFKIEGRTASALNILETYMYYMAKPECRDEARFMLLKALENSGALIYR
jgi:collagenase-like PrtC family protease